MKNIPPLSPLISFHSAAKYQSFTEAAHQLNLTHGAVSRAVKQLEDYFGTKLFHRESRGVYLTEKGRYFAKHVARVLKELEHASEQVRTNSEQFKLYVSCEPSLAMRWLMPRLEEFKELAPHIDIHLSTSGGPIDLCAESAHLAIRRADFAWPKKYNVTLIGNERIAPVCSPSYWEKTRGNDMNLLHTRTRPTAWEDWKSLTSFKISELTNQFFDHFYFSLQASSAGMGIAIGPEPLVKDDIDRGLLVAPFGFQTTEFEYVILSHASPEVDHRLIKFTEWIKEQLPMG
ncbi:LysR substrate-binding domain-containing protein [Halodesulfovibrio spirochaetisodalis]|nr:LysR substrate-binding domain-containing protein [Halodesulfovibrio spirochaetisodalis]